MQLRLMQLRLIWCPTWVGSFFLVALVMIPVIWWWICGQSFLSVTQRLQSEVLVVEGWIGSDGIRAARAEFEQHGYQYVVAAGGLNSDSWAEQHVTFAEMAARELMRLGVPEDKIIVAPSEEAETQRTYESAVDAYRALRCRGIHPRAVNVFTSGLHARRSRLIFAKVQGPETKVGVVAWFPPRYEATQWWRSSEQAKAMLTETAGYVFEVLLDSGRPSNSPEVRQSPERRLPPSGRHFEEKCVSGTLSIFPLKSDLNVETSILPYGNP
jgi:uncharacterized SAM-binding protein YcdF (DUF218 family)